MQNGILTQERKRASIGPRALKEPGSIDWCFQSLNHLKDVFERIQTWTKKDRDEFWRTVAELKEAQAWDKVPPDNPYGSYGKMIEAELGVSQEIANDDARFDEYVGFLGWGGDRRSKEFNNFQAYNSKVEKWGNHKTYILKRLERDYPDILAAYKRGEYPSARQAGIAAGFVKDVKRIQVLPDPEKIAAKLKEVLTTDQIQELIRLLQDD